MFVNHLVIRKVTHRFGFALLNIKQNQCVYLYLFYRYVHYLQIVNKEMRTFHMDKGPFHRLINWLQYQTGKHSAAVELGFQFLLQGLLLAMLFYRASIPKISDSTLNEICSHYDVEREQRNFHISKLTDVCSQLEELTSVSLFFPVVFSIVVLAIPFLSTRLLPRNANST